MMKAVPWQLPGVLSSRHTWALHHEQMAGHMLAEQKTACLPDQSVQRCLLVNLCCPSPGKLAGAL